MSEDHWVLTDPAGIITGISHEVAALLGISVRAAIGRPLPNFFGADRIGLLTDMYLAEPGPAPLIRERLLRPRNRAPIRVAASITCSADAKMLLWGLRALQPQRMSDGVTPAEGTPGTDP